MTDHSPLPPLSGDFIESLSGGSFAIEYLPNMEELEEISSNSSPCRNFEKRIMVMQVCPKPTIVGRVAHTSAVTTNVTKSIGYQVPYLLKTRTKSLVYVFAYCSISVLDYML